MIMQLKNLLPALMLTVMFCEPIFAREASDRPEIKYSNKRFEVKVPVKKVRTLEVEIRDMNDNLVYGTKYYNVSNFEKIYNISQLEKGKYFVKIVSDGNVYQDVIKVKRRH
jgi:hypothetical protein